MNEKWLVLDRKIQEDLGRIEKIYEDLGEPALEQGAPPAVIDDEAYEKLDELLRFRHLFRTGYGVDLDPLRLQIVLLKAMQLRPIYRQQIERFLEHVNSLE